jgi:hypothetical protein
MIDSATLIHHDAESVTVLRDELVRVYLDAHAGDGPFYTEERYRRQLDTHMRASGWALVAASIDLGPFVSGCQELGWDVCVIAAPAALKFLAVEVPRRGTRQPAACTIPSAKHKFHLS